MPVRRVKLAQVVAGDLDKVLAAILSGHCELGACLTSGRLATEEYEDRIPPRPVSVEKVVLDVTYEDVIEPRLRPDFGAALH